MKLLFAAFALSFLLEGVAFAFFPRLMRECMLHALSMPDSGLRRMGILAILTAITIIFIIAFFQGWS